MLFEFIKIILGLALAFFLPVYLMMKGFSQMERIFYSALIGLGLFPTAVYYMAILTGSMRYSAVLCFFIMLLLGFFVHHLFSPAFS